MIRTRRGYLFFALIWTAFTVINILDLLHVHENGAPRVLGR